MLLKYMYYPWRKKEEDPSPQTFSVMLVSPHRWVLPDLGNCALQVFWGRCYHSSCSERTPSSSFWLFTSLVQLIAFQASGCRSKRYYNWSCQRVNTFRVEMKADAEDKHCFCSFCPQTGGNRPLLQRVQGGLWIEGSQVHLLRQIHLMSQVPLSPNRALTLAQRLLWAENSASQHLFQLYFKSCA